MVALESIITTLESLLDSNLEEDRWLKDDWDYGYYAGIRRAIEILKQEEEID